MKNNKFLNIEVTKKNFWYLYATFFTILLLVGGGLEKAWDWHKQQEVKKLAQQIHDLPIDSNKQTNSNKYGILECTYGCPKYYSWDITGDHTSQTVIILPTAMNHGAGKLIIVDKGNVIFESPELAQIYVKPDNTLEENGFDLTYSNDIYTKTMKTDKYKYINGVFKLVKSSDSTFNIVN